MKRVLPLGLLLSLAVACTAEAPGSSGNPPTGGNTAGTGGQAGAPAGSGGQSGSGGSPVAGSGGSGGSGGSSGSGGSAPSGGSGGSARADAGRADGRTPDGRPRDAASGADRARTADAGASDVSAAVPSDGFGGGPLTECPTPSIGRLQQWQAHANTVPATGSLLVREGDQYVAKVRFPGGPWSEVVVPIANNEAMTANLTMSKGFTIRYSATADLHVQMRGGIQPHGGDQHVVKLPSTGGETKTLSARFQPEDWTFVPGLGRPRVTLADVVRGATIFDFVGNTANQVVVYSLRFDNYLPPCR